MLPCPRNSGIIGEATEQLFLGERSRGLLSFFSSSSLFHRYACPFALRHRVLLGYSFGFPVFSAKKLSVFLLPALRGPREVLPFA